MPCKIAKCVAEAVSPDGLCAVHAKYAEAQEGTRCATCTQALRVGTFARKRSDGRLEHVVCPPPRVGRWS